jgi:hypothetical protein
MAFLYMLENIRVPVLNEFMLAVTYLGDEIAFLVTALILIWCADKRTGYYVLSVGFLGTIANQFMKLWFRIPRPWVFDENFTILEQAREGASGYSFPSGHTQSSVGTFGAIAYTTKYKVLRWLCIAAVILVPFSRMYIGVHTPLDVGVAALMAGDPPARRRGLERYAKLPKGLEGHVYIGRRGQRRGQGDCAVPVQQRQREQQPGDVLAGHVSWQRPSPAGEGT